MPETAVRIISGRTTVATSGTAVQLTTNDVSAYWVMVSAEADNTGVVAVGDANVDASPATQQGVLLRTPTGENPDTHTFWVNDASQLYVDADDDGDGVAWLIGVAS